MSETVDLQGRVLEACRNQTRRAIEALSASKKPYSSGSSDNVKPEAVRHAVGIMEAQVDMLDQILSPLVEVKEEVIDV